MLLTQSHAVLALWVWEHPADDLLYWINGEQQLGLDLNEQPHNFDAAWEKIQNAQTPVHVAYRHLKNNSLGSELWQDPLPLMKLLQPVTESELESILSNFCPEIKVNPSLTVREGPQTLSAQFTGFLLDATQEDAMKRDLLLPRSQEKIVNALKAQVVAGVAGSGKSLVLLYRLRMLRNFFPKRSQHALVLTHNKALAADLKERYRILNREDANHVEFSTFMSWFGRRPEAETWTNPLSEFERMDILKQSHARHLAETSLTVDQFTQELGWLKDQGLPNRNHYLEIPRTGQGFALQLGQRERIYDAVEYYEESLRTAGKRDWHDVPLSLWKRLDHGRKRMQFQYDILFIDETQFCAPIWFDLIRAAIDPEQGMLFMAADPTQGFLRRRQSWRGLGLDVRGQVVRLNKSYRTTQEILSFASMFYRRRLPEDSEAILATDLAHLPKGPMPFILPVRSPHDEYTRVENEIDRYLVQGGKASQVLVIHCSSRGARHCLSRLQQKFGTDQAVDPRTTPNASDAIRVLSLDAATGLESRVVFLLGAHELYEQEQALRISEEERIDRIRQNTKRLYTAITRAGQCLFITFSGKIPEDFI
ncbi:AAA family ATPase [Kiritimatiellaeota bacterium B1221]|nr:AAA family ATPase [Kiritimatiellaeota bacterium B1221]